MNATKADIEQIALNAIRYRAEDEHDAEATVRGDRGWLLDYIDRHNEQAAEAADREAADRKHSPAITSAAADPNDAMRLPEDGPHEHRWVQGSGTPLCAVCGLLRSAYKLSELSRSSPEWEVRRAERIATVQRIRRAIESYVRVDIRLQVVLTILDQEERR